MEKKFKEQFDRLNKLIYKGLPKLQKIGLLNGKLGVCIYLFHLSQQTKDQKYLTHAEKLLDELVLKLSTSKYSYDFEEGLAGIAWGIEYLIRNNFIKADANEILQPLDEKIYKHIICSEKKLSLQITSGILGYGFYAISRIKTFNEKNTNDINYYLIKQLLIFLINKISVDINKNKNFYRDPYLFNHCCPVNRNINNYLFLTF